MRTIDAMKKLARNDGRFTHVYTKKELSELFNETGSKLNGTLKSLIKENILNRAYHNVYVFRLSFLSPFYLMFVEITVVKYLTWTVENATTLICLILCIKTVFK